jgi:L-alanine-DL-glutamate epimerase-like enolase superfamily enzyme
MKIKKIETFIADGGFRPWTIVRIETDDGIVGWGDCTDWGGSGPVAATIEALKPYVIGEDPLETDYIWEKLSSRNARHLTGIAHKAMAGIDIACWDIKGKYYNAPIWKLLGGKFRDTLPLYWTHFGWARTMCPEVVAKKQLRSRDDILEMCAEAKEEGFAGVKTNVDVMRPLGYDPFPLEPIFQYDREREMLRGFDDLLSTMREGLGDDIGIAVDVAFGYKLGASKRLAELMAPYKPMWLECETHDAGALREIRHSSGTPICIGESMFGVRQYIPFFKNYALDVVMPDVAWNGFTETKRIAEAARLFDITVAPHNCHSPVTSLACAQLCANLPNFYLLEFDYDDVPWRDDLLMSPLDIRNGHLVIPDGPGLGIEVNEKELRKHPAKTYTTR